MMNISKTLPRGKLIKLGGDTTWVELRYENLPYVCFYCGILGHNEKTYVQRAKDIRSDTLKRDQFGAWLKAENRVASADNQRHEGVHSTEGHNLIKVKIFKLIKGKRDVGIGKSLIHIQQGVDSTNT
ncbi:hypothetical protein KY289_035616 [Solanum tuberosum]|nr:hypothetical protein KY289_035616 [Solanum tuberosum]